MGKTEEACVFRENFYGGENDFFVLKNVVQGFERLNKLNKIYIFCSEKYECFFKVFSFGLLLCTFCVVENS